MEAVLRCDGKVHLQYAEVLREYREMPALANAVWAQRGGALLPAYVELLRGTYGAPPELVDFATPEPVAARINAWVAERTRERIKDIVNADMFTPDTRLVLVNALWFKAAWEHPFTARVTKERPFTLASGQQVSVPFMAQTASFAYAEMDGAQAVELPYEGGRFSMVLVLPASGEPRAVPAGLLEALEECSVGVYLPRFRIETAYRLDDTLKAMGMSAAFGRDADFSGMNGRKDLFVGLVAHKAFVAVDEAGTEAAAATAIVMMRGAAPAKTAEFRADRPFLFLIRDAKTGTILFLGRVSDPRPTP
jgi:serpin B